MVTCGHGHSGRQETYKRVFHAGRLTERQKNKATTMGNAEPLLTRVGGLRRVVPTAGPDLVFRHTSRYYIVCGKNPDLIPVQTGGPVTCLTLFVR